MTVDPREAETNTATRRPRFDPSKREDVVAPAQAIGRFRVLGRVGAGGMGQVYAAYDPVLDRRVALKLLHAHRSEHDSAALVREAKTLARLSHPNVVAVHDVGVQDGLVFLAMEFVDGTTLKGWHRRPTKDLAETLDVLVQAGRGLMAAHDAGIVHGDFKPQNVLIGRDGRVRVADFGVARIRRGVATLRDASRRDTQSVDETSDGSTPRIAGTPAYMAPEQLGEGRTDVLSDQYSYCVSAWELFHGRRPPEVDASVTLPPELVRALEKGLAERSSARHRSMAALVEALHAASPNTSASSTRVRRRVLAATGGVALSAAAFAGYALRDAEDPPSVAPCSGAEARTTEVFDDDDRARLQAALRKDDLPFAQDTERTVLRHLDAFTRDWQQGYVAACEATQVRHEQSSELMDLRMVCLDNQLRDLDATVETLVSIDASKIRNAVKVAEALHDPRDCADLDYVRSAPHAAVPPDQRAQLGPLQQMLSEARAAYKLGAYRKALALASDADALAETLGFLRARAKLRLGWAQEAVSDTRAASKTLDAAFLLAETSGDTETASQAASGLALTLGQRQHAYARGEPWANIAVALARRDTTIAARVLPRALLRQAEVQRDQGKYAEALEASREALALAPAGSLLEASLQASVGKTREYLPGPGGVTELTQALQTYEALLGPTHPVVADALFDLSQVTTYRGDTHRGLEHITRALAIYRAIEGPTGYNVGSATALAAELKAAHGQLDTALADHRRALEILESAVGPDHVEVGAQHSRIGTVLSKLGRHEQALHQARRAAEIMRAAVGPEHMLYRTAMLAVAGCERRAGRLDDAESSYRTLASTLPETIDPFTRADLAKGLGAVQEARGQSTRAAKQYLDAADILDAASEQAAAGRTYALAATAYLDGGEPTLALNAAERSLARWTEDAPLAERAQARFLVARSLWDAGGDRARARDLAQQAASWFADNEPSHDSLPPIRAWLDAHP